MYLLTFVIHFIIYLLLFTLIFLNSHNPYLGCAYKVLPAFGKTLVHQLLSLKIIVEGEWQGNDLVLSCSSILKLVSISDGIFFIRAYIPSFREVRWYNGYIINEHNTTVRHKNRGVL